MPCDSNGEYPSRGASAAAINSQKAIFKPVAGITEQNYCFEMLKPVRMRMGARGSALWELPCSPCGDGFGPFPHVLKEAQARLVCPQTTPQCPSSFMSKAVGLISFHSLLPIYILSFLLLKRQGKERASKERPLCLDYLRAIFTLEIS